MSILPIFGATLSLCFCFAWETDDGDRRRDADIVPHRNQKKRWTKDETEKKEREGARHKERGKRTREEREL